MLMPGGDCTSDIFLWVTFCRRPHFKSEILRFCPVVWRCLGLVLPEFVAQKPTCVKVFTVLRSRHCGPYKFIFLQTKHDFAIDGRRSLVTVYGQARYVTLPRAATCPSLLQTGCPWKSCSPLRLCIWSCFSFAEHIRTSFNGACCKQVCCKRVFPRKNSWIRQNPKRFHRWDPRERSIVLKVFEDGQTFMAFWDRMILKEPSYKTTRLHIS